MDNIDRKIDLHIIVGIREVVFNILALSNLSDDDIRTALSKVVRRNEIEYDALLSSTYYSPNDYEVMVKLIERKMLEEDIEIYIFSVIRVPLASETCSLTKLQIFLLFTLLLILGALILSSLIYWIAKGM